MIITPKRHFDDRGFFSESWNKQRLEEFGLPLPEFVQDNHSFSHSKGTLRGMHYQAPPHSQGKLVRCGRGRIFDVAVDVRNGSATYGGWVGVELSFENGKQLWVPQGFVHGFLTLEPDCEIFYKVTQYYNTACEGSVHWASCGVRWPLSSQRPLVSEKDAKAIDLNNFSSPFSYDSTDK